MKIAIEGCAHGCLETIYETLAHIQETKGVKVDLLICCGDFQAVRNHADMECMAVPPKYREMGTFYKYYSGEKKAPILTIFIGGNHEASNHMQELAYGGWVAPNIYYMGYASVVKFRGIRIGGISGIFKGHDYLKGHFETVPYDRGTVRSAYHVRNLETFRLKQLEKPLDIFLSHDWPCGVYDHGDVEGLLRRKPYFTEEVREGKLGSRPCKDLLVTLKPTYWFSAHLHVKFAAVVKHENEKKTKFLALDKCLPRRLYLQIVDIPDESSESSLSYDIEWLTTLRLTDHLLSVSSANQYMPGPGQPERFEFTPTESEMAEVLDLLDNNLIIPQNFEQSVPVYDPHKNEVIKLNMVTNPQTTEFCKKLGIRDPQALLLEQQQSDSANTSTSMYSSWYDSDPSSVDTSQMSINPEEISIDDNEEENEVEMDSPSSTSDSQVPLASVTRTSLVLPKPAVVDIFPEISTVRVPESVGVPDIEPPKKFRRRNESIYNADCDS